MSGSSNQESPAFRPGSVKHYQLARLDFVAARVTLHSMSQDAKTLAGIMSAIYRENPDAWPYGLSPQHFREPGSKVWLINRPQPGGGAVPVGFAGWQSRPEAGYYSIGVLPDFRRQGIGQAAVKSLLAEVRAGGDNAPVRALISHRNLPSMNMAAKLNIPVSVVKSAAGGWSRFAWSAIPTILSDALQGSMHGGTDSSGRDLGFMGRWGQDWKDRPVVHLANLLVNPFTGLQYGAGGKKFNLRNPVTQVSTGTKDTVTSRANQLFREMAVKDLGLTALAEAGPVLAVLKGQGRNQAAQPPAGWTTGQKALAGGGIVAALAAAALALRNQTVAAEAARRQATGGKGVLRVALPTKKPGDQETQIEMPFDATTMLSRSLRQRLSRDTKRRLRTETVGRTYRAADTNPGEVYAIE